MDLEFLNHCAYPIQCVGRSLSIRQPLVVPPHLIVPTQKNISKLANASFIDALDGDSF